MVAMAGDGGELNREKGVALEVRGVDFNLGKVSGVSAGRTGACYGLARSRRQCGAMRMSASEVVFRAH